MKYKLPNCFSSYKSVLPVLNERYGIRHPAFYLPVIKHKFTDQLLITVHLIDMFAELLRMVSHKKNLNHTIVHVLKHIGSIIASIYVFMCYFYGLFIFL